MILDSLIPFRKGRMIQESRTRDWIGVKQNLCSTKTACDQLRLRDNVRTFWYNCSPFCGLSAQWFYGGAYTSHLPGLLQPEPLSPQQATADPCRRHSNTQKQFWLSLLWGPWVLVSTWFCLSLLSISGGYGV